MRRNLILTALIAGGLAFAPAASATTVIPMSTADMAEIATVIVDATVGQAVARVDTVEGPARRLINTHVTIQVIDWIKTPDEETPEETSLEFLSPGGTVSTPRLVRSVVPGTPEFKPGTRAIFYLWQTPAGDYLVVGLSRGFVPVRQSERAGEERFVVPLQTEKDDKGTGLPGEQEGHEHHQDHEGHPHVHAAPGTDAGLVASTLPLTLYKQYVRACVLVHSGRKAIDPTTGKSLVLEKNPLLDPWRKAKQN